MLPAHPFPGVGGERSETEGGGWMGHSAARVQKVQRGRFLRWTGLMAGGFLSLTGPLAPRVVDCRSAAMLIKSALRINLYASYVM